MLLILLLATAKKARRGGQAALFVTGLGLSQILLEQMRRDDFVRLNHFVRFSQIAALLSLIAVLVLFMHRRRPERKLVIASWIELVFASLSITFAEFVFQKPQYTEVLYVFAALAAVGIAVLLKMYGMKCRLPFSLVLIAGTAALLGIYIADQWTDNTGMLYGFMAIALTAIGLIIWVNRPKIPQES